MARVICGLHITTAGFVWWEKTEDSWEQLWRQPTNLATDWKMLLVSPEEWGEEE